MKTADRILLAIVLVLNVATSVMCVFIAIDANKHRAARQPFLDTAAYHTERAASAPSAPR